MHMCLSLFIADGNQHFDQLLHPNAAPSNLAAQQRVLMLAFRAYECKFFLFFWVAVSFIAIILLLLTDCCLFTYACLLIFAYIWRVYPHWALSIPIQIEFLACCWHCGRRRRQCQYSASWIECFSKVLLLRFVDSVAILAALFQFDALLGLRATSALLPLAGCFVGRTHSCLDRCSSWSNV